MMEVRNSGPESQILDLSQPIQKTDADSATIAGPPVSVVADGGVKAEVGNAGGGAQVVKRKRGRPPRVAKKSKEEDDDEDVCFICFDGGSLVLCDRRGCPKAYHPACIKRDEAFFRSKAKWNCGWHICSICEKTAHHMCYTCSYSLCKGCIKKSDYVCVRGDKGFCTVCMKTIMLIENNGDATAHVDFDDKTSWEYLFKVYWVYLKGKLSLTLNDITEAQNPWKTSSTVASFEPTVTHISASGRRSITSDLEANESKRRKTYEQSNGLPKESPSMIGPKEWASKELLNFVAHMKNDTSMLSQFDVQALLLEYIKRNNLRDPRKKTQIICDSMLKNLFGKSHVGHIEMLKLLELHFLLKEDSQKNTINRNKLDEYAAIDVHNMNLIYLRRNMMESLIEDSEKFHEKVIGSIVQIRISGSDQKDDMYRLVQVVGMTKVDVPYKIGDKLVDVMLEVLNLDKKEIVSIDTISNQELSEDECRRMRESIRCGLVRCFTVGEIQEKAMNLQSVLLDDRMETEMLRLNRLRDRASQKGQKKGLRECVKKLKLLKTPEERERRLREIPEIHSDPKMNPDYESDDTEEYFNNEHEPLKPKFPWVSGTNTITPKRKTDSLPLNDQPRDSGVTTYPKLQEDSSKSNTLNTSNTGKDAVELSGSKTPQPEVECKGPTVSKPNPEAAVSSSLSNNNDDMWYYRDPSGNVQGPFSMIQLQKWSTSGYFPVDMKIWATREADSLLLNKVLQDQFNNYNGQLPENVACNNKDSNQIEGVNVCSSIPSSAISATPYALNSVNLENLACSNKDGNEIKGVNVCSSIPSSTISATPYGVNSFNLEKLPNNNYNLNCNPPSVVSLSKMNESTEPFDIQKIPDINQHVSCNNKDGNQSESVDVYSSIPSSTIPATSYTPISVNLEKLPINSYNLNCNAPCVASLTKTNESTEPFDTQKMPDINQHVSSVFTVADVAVVNLPSKKESHENEKVEDFRDKELPVTSSKLVVQDSGNPPSWSTALSLVVGGTQLPETTDEWGRYPQVATTNAATMDQITNLPSWHGLGETIEFSTLAEESVSDLLAEVDAMESRNGVPSPTSRRNSFLEDLFNGSIDDFSPTTDQSTPDIQLSNQSTGLQFSFGIETKPTCPVSIPQSADSDNMGFKWGEMGGSELQPPPPRQDMIDLNYSTEGERETGTHYDQVEEKSKNQTVTMVNSKCKEKEGGRIKAEVAGTKAVGGFPEAEEEEGEFIQPEAGPPPLLPLPPPPPLSMGFDLVDSRKAVSGRPSQGATSTGRVHSHTSASRSGNVGRDSHHRRSDGGGDRDRDRYNSNSPRERSHHGEDSGYSRSSSRASWSRQSSFSGGGGSGYSRPPSKGQRVCKFYESGRCKKGSACNYLHPQER